MRGGKGDHHTARGVKCSISSACWVKGVGKGGREDSARRGVCYRWPHSLINDFRAGVLDEHTENISQCYRNTYR